MITVSRILSLAVLITLMALCGAPDQGDAMSHVNSAHLVELPAPSMEGAMPLESALQKRRSVRTYAREPLTLEDVAQLLWAAQGITAAQGFRTAPSAGALYPLEIYIVAGNVDALTAGIYRYKPHSHQLARVRRGDHRSALADAGLGQACLRNAPAVIVLTGVAARITPRYGQRGTQYMFMEAGHAGQNICLQAVSRHLGAVPIGAFKEDQVREVLQIDASELPLYLIPIGRPQTH